MPSAQKNRVKIGIDLFSIPSNKIGPGSSYKWGYGLPPYSKWTEINLWVSLALRLGMS